MEENKQEEKIIEKESKEEEKHIFLSSGHVILGYGVYN